MDDVRVWRERLEAAGFFVRGLSVHEGARLFAAADVPVEAVEHDQPRGFAVVPHSEMSIARLEGGRWRLSWPGGVWEGAVPDPEWLTDAEIVQIRQCLRVQQGVLDRMWRDVEPKDWFDPPLNLCVDRTELARLLDEIEERRQPAAP